MRISVLVLAVLMTVLPAVARRSHSGHRSSGGGHSYSSHSYRSRSAGSSYRRHSHSTRSSPNRFVYGRHHSYGARSYRSGTSTYSGAQRDSHGRIKRSAAAKDSFKRQHPCPSTGRSTGACPGYVIDHIKPLANGGADDPSNMQWQTKAAAKEKDKWERRH